MGNVRMRAEQINYGASNVKVALDDLDPKDLIALSARMDTIEAWKATVKAEEKTGASVEYTNALALAAVSLSAEIVAIQGLHGYGKPWAGGAGKNKLPLTLANLKSLNTGGIWSGNSYTLDNVTFDVQTDDGGNVIGIKGNGTASNTTTFVISPLMDLSTFNAMLISGNTAANDVAIIRMEMIDNPWTGYSQSGGTDVTIGTYAAETNGRTFIRVFSGKTLTNQMFYPMIRNSGESATFAPYTNFCPISGRTEVSVDDEGKNKLQVTATSTTLNGIAYTVNSDGTIAANNTATNLSTLKVGEFTGLNNIIMSGCPSGGSASNYNMQIYDATTAAWGNSDYGEGVTVNNLDTSHTYYVYAIIRNGVTANNLLFKPMIRLASDTDPAFVPYQHSSDTIQLGQTVYGGTLNVTTGVLTITDVIEDMGNLTYSKLADYIFAASISDKAIGRTNFLSSQYAVVDSAWGSLANGQITGAQSSGYIHVKDERYNDENDFKTALTGQTICYELATPITIQLTPTQLTMLKGYNRLSSDGGGDITIEAYTGAAWGGDEA